MISRNQDWRSLSPLRYKSISRTKKSLPIVWNGYVFNHLASWPVHSNVTSQCLVCLEDYLEEEEIRIMRCRHAFHKVCVDEWMQKGRNNCPACRSMVHFFIYLSLTYSDSLLYFRVCRWMPTMPMIRQCLQHKDEHSFPLLQNNFWKANHPFSRLVVLVVIYSTLTPFVFPFVLLPVWT